MPRDPDVVRSASRKARERPASFAAMGDTKRRFEEGHERRERLREERKGELTKLRGLICGVSRLPETGDWRKACVMTDVCPAQEKLQSFKVSRVDQRHRKL